MPDAVDRAEWDRIAALIEECRAEREACASVRDQLRRGDVANRSLYAAVRERFLAGAVELSAVALTDDKAP